mgnify:CR=1 FL=1
MLKTKFQQGCFIDGGEQPIFSSGREWRRRIGQRRIRAITGTNNGEQYAVPAFLELLEQRAIECFKKVKGTKKQVCSNVDFYSGFIYELMGLPHEIYTPLFAMARIVGWTAHRIEELNFEGRRIIRPAYKNVLEEVDYKPIGER